jgi:hypothetical protein
VVRIAIAVACVLATAQARADGYYYSEQLGFSTARGRDAQALATSLHTRAGLGVRWGGFSIEPWVEADLAFDRDGATLELFGGAPAMGHADLEGFGLDARYSEPLGDRFSVYVRAGPRYATATGSLSAYRGFGFGTGTGIALIGKVRAFGFLWAPLFFVKKGPLVRAALYLDEGLDFYELEARGMPTITAPVLSTSLGFAVGTDF